MKRKIIKIDEAICTGCGLCIPECPEGAIQLIDGKARLVSDLFCDGLGACLGFCPEGAITIEERESEPYDEIKVMENIVKQGKNTILAHIKHLRDHGETVFLNQAMEYLKERHINIADNEETKMNDQHFAGCPGSRNMELANKTSDTIPVQGQRPSQLSHWPIQMHLISPTAPHYRNADLLLAADCVAFSMGDFHNDYLKGKKLAIACPKLDDGRQVYLDKLIALIDMAEINTLTVMTMQVPCCGGLLSLALQAVESAERKVPVKNYIVSLEGEILREEWI
ncbi:4Fe-4S dicluster domain-containing protein [candidate division KSB1 bacterium]|nr:4Fe-4S dicluster domain-containing protein [candidate division KSB1 bacterium]